MKQIYSKIIILVATVIMGFIATVEFNKMHIEEEAFSK